MPYITDERREDLIEGDEAQTPGELNYELTCLVLKYVGTHGESYQTYNDVVGALECCKMELYRRLISAYEDKKIQDNGDVYES